MDLADLRAARCDVPVRVEFDDQSIGIRDVHVPTDVAFGRPGVADTKGVQILAPTCEVAAVTDAQRDRTEPAERTGKRRCDVQPDGYTAAVDGDDSGDVVFFLYGEPGLETECAGIPISAADDVRDGQANVVNADDGHIIIGAGVCVTHRSGSHTRHCTKDRRLSRFGGNSRAPELPVLCAKDRPTGFVPGRPYGARPRQRARNPIRFCPTLIAWEGIAVQHLQFEATVAAVLGFVLLLGFVLIGLLHAATI